MAHSQKPDLVFQRNGRVNLNWRGRQFSRLLAAEVCASAVVMLDAPCSGVECKTTGYPLHSHVSPSLPLPCVTVCHQVSIELYKCLVENWCLYFEGSSKNTPKMVAESFSKTLAHANLQGVIYRTSGIMQLYSRLRGSNVLCLDDKFRLL